MYDDSIDPKRKDPNDFPVGSAWRYLLEQNNGVIPPLSVEVLNENMERLQVESAEKVTASSFPDHYRLLKDIENRLGLPELSIYAITGDSVSPTKGALARSCGAIFLAEDYFSQPLEQFECTLLHEIGHGFQDRRFDLCVKNAANFLGLMALDALWLDTFSNAFSSLYTAATLVHNLNRMAMELDADRFAIQHAGDPSQELACQADFFRRRYPEVATEEGQPPFTFTTVVKEAVGCLQRILTTQHPPHSIRYAVAAREVALENQRRGL